MKSTVIAPGQYAKAIREAMRRSVDPETGMAPVTLKGLGRMLYHASSAGEGIYYSYEHLRRLLAGLPVQSQNCNDVLCHVLKLDKDKMWELALAEKAMRKYGHLSPILAAPEDRTLREAWPHLTTEEKQTIRQAVQGMVANRKMAKFAKNVG